MSKETNKKGYMRKIEINSPGFRQGEEISFLDETDKVNKFTVILGEIGRTKILREIEKVSSSQITHFREDRHDPDVSWEMANKGISSGVVMIEEVVLHLHPKRQAQYCDNLKKGFPSVQFIVTTNSPIVAQAEGANLVVLSQEKGQIIINNAPHVIRGWRVDQILTSDLFGLESARPKFVLDWQAERDGLLEIENRSDGQEARLVELETKIADLPTADSHEDQEAMGLIRETARILRDRLKTGDEVDQIFADISKEVIRADKLHGPWPENLSFGVAIVGEEFGEVAKAVVDQKKGDPLDHIEAELIQTASVCVRFLLSLRKKRS